MVFCFLFFFWLKKKSIEIFFFFLIVVEFINCINCFSCDWYADYPTSDPRCGWNNNFTIPRNQSDNSVANNCEKCAIGLLWKDG